MSYEIVFRAQARKAFLALPPDVRDRIETRLDVLKQDPRTGDTRKLKGKLQGLMRLRVGDYRVAFVVDDRSRTIDVLKVGPRGSFYE